MKAFVFPGQGAQFPGMGRDLYQNDAATKASFDRADDILGFSITDIMFEGDDESLRATDVTQPAIFLHSVILAQILGHHFKPDMVAGHSLGEFSALVASHALSFEDGLRLVSQRAQAMQAACEQVSGTMAAILGLDDEVVESVCAQINDVVVPANYNCPGQLVISGSIRGIELACEALKEAGARRALVLPVGGAFHSPLMAPARDQLAAAIEQTHFDKPICPIYQNVHAAPETDPKVIKENLVAQLTAPVRWTQSVQKMAEDGAQFFTEVGPGKVLQGLVKKINKELEVSSAEI